MKMISIKMKEVDNVFDFDIESENVNEHFVKRVELFFENFIKVWLDTGLYNISTFKFKVTDENIKVKKKKRMPHGLSIIYNIVNGEGDIYTTWDGKKEMDAHSKELLHGLIKENGLIEVLRCGDFNIKTIDMKIKTIEKFY